MKIKSLISKISVVVLACSCLVASACSGKTITTQLLSSYQGENKDDNGRTIYNESLFYSNQIMKGGPDPFVLDDTTRSGYYYAYYTGKFFPAMRSTNLVEWDECGPILSMATPNIKNIVNANNWAPEVVYDEQNDYYLMFFSASPVMDDTVSNGSRGVIDGTDSINICNMYVASSKTPDGPFEILNFKDTNSVGSVAIHDYNVQPNKILQSSNLDDKVWINQNDVYYEAAFPQYYAKYCYFDPAKLSNALNDLGWRTADGEAKADFYSCIDPSPFVDPVTKEKYLYFRVADNSWNAIVGIKMKDNNWLTPDWDSVDYCVINGYYTILDWKSNTNRGVVYENSIVNEAPCMIYHEDELGVGKYYLTFSINSYVDSRYSVATAVGDSPLGPFRKLTEEEGALLISSQTMESQTVSGAGHHSYIKVGEQEFVVYHRHRDYSVGGAERYVATDEMKWITITDIDGNSLDVPYLNGPNDSIQPLPEKYSEYRNIAPLAQVSCSNKAVDVSWLTDGLLSVHKSMNEDFMEYVRETEITAKETFSFKFDTAKTLRSIMVYNSKMEDKLFKNIARIDLVLEDGSKRTIVNAEYDIEQYCMKDDYIDMIYYSLSGSCTFAEFYEIKVKSIAITVDVPKGQDTVGISEIRLLGKDN